MERFIIQQSQQDSNAYICTDTANGIVCSFKAHRFNDTQKFTLLEDVTHPNALTIARIMREMGDWLREHHYNKIF